MEGVQNRVAFQKGDAAHLDFPDESFDAVVSNFVFHEVRSEKNKRKVVREALRVLKKGGSFSLQDLFSQEKLYGNMEEFADELRREGFQEVHYIPFIERERWIPRYKVRISVSLKTLRAHWQGAPQRFSFLFFQICLPHQPFLSQLDADLGCLHSSHSREEYPESSSKSCPTCFFPKATVSPSFTTRHGTLIT